MKERCPVSFWRWAAPVTVGNIAALGTGYLARQMARNRHPKTAATIGLFVGGATFWLVGGLVWVAMKPPEPAPCPRIG